jgi:hypothetical protein
MLRKNLTKNKKRKIRTAKGVLKSKFRTLIMIIRKRLKVSAVQVLS